MLCVFGIDFVRPRYDLVMASITVIFDESGKQGSSEHVVFAGFYAVHERWDEFSLEWNLRLKRAGVTYWSTKNAANLDGQYKQFRNRRNDLHDLAISLARIICRFAVGGTAQIVTVEQFKSLDQEARERLKDPWYCAFESGMRSLLEADALEPNDLFMLLCDDSEEYSSECLKIYRRLRKQYPALAGKIAGIGFMDDRFHPPVQAADLFAYCHRKKAEGITKGIWTDTLAVLDETFSVQKPGDLVV